ncbi:phytochrome-like protein cph2 [mine drainage metagenome]|uniref:Phytochrome-like protein cph2 n=1 Tax=mine drainage metagenome TaxID=410659 RepID=A0A1J5QST5_9ZZZZ
MLYQRLQNASIRTKLAVVSFVAIIAALVLVLTVMVTYEFFSFRHIQAQELWAQARIIGDNSSAALAFDDPRVAKDVLAALHASPSVERAAIFLADGTLFASYAGADTSRPEPLRQPAWRGTRYDWSGMVLSQAILLGGKPVGQLVLEANFDRMYQQLALYGSVALLAGIIALVLAWLLHKPLDRCITRPILNMSELMNHVTISKDYSRRMEHVSRDEIGTLASGYNAMLAQMQQHKAALEFELEQRHLAEQRLDRLAHYDGITLLPNRNFFTASLAGILDATLQSGQLVALMFIDLDNFKIVNDTLGHRVGDLLLRAAAQRLTDAMRGNEIVCRIGGDEFAVILENVADLRQVESMAAEVVLALSQAFHLEENEIHIGASIGISLCPEHARELSGLLRSADTAMYHAKSLGKNNFQHYSAEMEQRALKRLAMENSLRHVLERNELLVYYQPQVDVDTHRVVGFEALVRWQHPEMGMISPNEFIPLAEDIGLIVPIGEWVLRTACLQAVRWQQAYCPELTIGVNLSARQLREPGIVDRILEVVDETGIPSHLLDLELTESALMERSDDLMQKMDRLRQAGIRISIDDFGTGYSSMSYLKRFPINTLKIDRGFIADIPHDTDDVAITQAIIAMGGSLNMQLIAEGVETVEQLEFLRTHGCNRIQGFLISRPLPVQQAEEFLAMERDRLAASGDAMDALEV